jgi:hypothetical protein
MTMVARSIHAADISAFVDIPTRHSCENYLLALIGDCNSPHLKYL